MSQISHQFRLEEVVDVSNESEADVFISIHCNACNEKARGTEVWYYHRSAYGEMLADCIRHQIVDALGTADRGSKGAKPGVNGLYVLNNTGATAVLVELAFIDNEQDEGFFATIKMNLHERLLVA